MTNGLTTTSRAPIELVTSEQVAATKAKIRVMVTDPRINDDMLKVIAQESILFRTLPGKDIHYFVNPKSGKLERVFDYKYLISFHENRERLRTGDPNLNIVYEAHTLTLEEKLIEGLAEDDYAVRVTVSTSRDRDAYRSEVANWLKLGLNVNQAMEAARRMMGDTAGVSALGVVARDEKNIPAGWSPLQKAEKLAIKNAINKRWGTPTVDELSTYVRQMARIETTDEDWLETPLDLPPEAQAHYAELQALAREHRAAEAGMTPDEHRERLANNPLNRDDDDADPAADPAQDFYERAVSQIPYFNHARHVQNTLGKLNLVYTQEAEAELLAALNEYAKQKADASAGQMTIGLFNSTGGGAAYAE